MSNVAVDAVEAGAEDILRVLVVDDSPLCRKMLSLKLRRKGCECVEAENGSDAVIKVAEAAVDGHPFDTILME